VTAAERAPGLAWTWSGAALGASYAAPAAIVAATDVRKGVALAVGVLPAAIIGLPARRRGRVVLGALGFLTGIPMIVGAVLAGVPVLAVAGVFVAGVGAAAVAARSPIGTVVMVLSLPLLGIGLSYTDVGIAATAAVLMVAGSIWACAVSMLWPQHTPQPRPPGVKPTMQYGVLLGLAGATAAAIGFIAGLEHVGWATGAALLVMRPSEEMQRLRSVGRVIAVVAGALAATALVRATAAPGWYSLAVIVALAGAAGTSGSRWYVAPAFTTAMVFLLLLYAEPQNAAHRFNERVLETILGVGLAYLYGLAVPKLLARRQASVRHKRGRPTPT
jgi:hypothetical protein